MTGADTMRAVAGVSQAEQAYGGRPWTSGSAQKVRARMRQHLPAPCAQCGGMVTEEDRWVVGHRVPRSIRPDLAWEPSNWTLEHRTCSARSGSRVASVARQVAADRARGADEVLREGPSDRAALSLPRSTLPPEHASSVREHPHFPHDRFPEVPAPLNFPPSHPTATGSRLAEFQAWLTQERGLPEGYLRPWQAATAERLLEVDSEGLWCWGITGALVVIPRQQGKSTLMNLLATWMAHSGLSVVSAAPVLRQLWDLVEPTFLWVDDSEANPPRTRLSRLQDKPSVTFVDSGGRWQGQAARLRLGVGSSVDSALLDEVWDMDPDAVTRGLLPAMSARPNPFLLMASTADVEGSSLMRRWRAAAMSDPTSVALVEWGAPAEADWTDVATWRAASPAWTPQRERYLRAQKDLVPELDFRTQYLNQEPRAVGISGWLDLSGLADAQPVPMGPVVASLESTSDGRWAVAWAWSHGGKVHLRVQEVGSSLARAVEAVGSLQPVSVLVHRATARRLAEPDWPVVAVTATDNLAATRAMEAMVKDGRLAFSGPVLAEQAPNARLGTTGVLDPGKSQGPVHAVQAATWAAYAAETTPTSAPEVF